MGIRERAIAAVIGYAAIAILVVIFLLKDMNGFTSVQAQKSLTRLSGAIKRLGFFDYVDVLKVMQENLIAARVRKDYSAKFFDGNSFTKYGKDFFASSLQAFEYIEVGKNEPISRNPSRAVLSFVPVDFFARYNSGLSFPIFVDTTVRLYRFGGTSDNIVLKFVYNEEKFVMKMDTLLKKLDRAIKKVPCADNPRLVNLYLMKALGARELAKKELAKVRDVAEGDVITHYTKQFEELSNLIDDLDSNLR